MKTNWKNNFKQGKELILATSSKDGVPHANIVISCDFVGDKLLIADCHMVTITKNLKENPKICVIGGYFRIKGDVEIFSFGKIFDLCVSRSASISSDKVKTAILVEIKEVFDLNKIIPVN